MELSKSKLDKINPFTTINNNAYTVEATVRMETSTKNVEAIERFDQVFKNSGTALQGASKWTV